MVSPTSAAPLRRAALLILLAVCVQATPAAAQPRERRAITAYPVTAPLEIDGALDEAFYRTVQPASDFIQIEPQDGAPATEKTEMWVGFDGDTCLSDVPLLGEPDGQGGRKRDAPRQHRASGAATTSWSFYLDTFYDRRNSVSFQFTPIGGWADGQFTNEARVQRRLEPGMDVQRAAQRGRLDRRGSGPLQVAPVPPGRGQIWGLQVRRINRWKNEISNLTRVPDGIGVRSNGRASNFVRRRSRDGSAVRPRNLEVKPYAHRV